MVIIFTKYYDFRIIPTYIINYSVNWIYLRMADLLTVISLDLKSSSDIKINIF